MMLVVEPFTLVVRSVHMHVFALAISPVVLPIAYVDISISMDDATKALLHVIHEITVIPCPIRPNLSSPSMTLTLTVPFSFILYFGEQKHLIFELDFLTALLDHAFTELIIPFELPKLFDFHIDDLTLVVCRKFAILRRVFVSQVKRRVFNNAFYKFHCEKTSRTCL